MFDAMRGDGAAPPRGGDGAARGYGDRYPSNIYDLRHLLACKPSSCPLLSLSLALGFLIGFWLIRPVRRGADRSQVSSFGLVTNFHFGHLLPSLPTGSEV